MKKQLDEMFSQFEERKQKEQAAAQASKDQDAESRRRLGNVLSEKVLPVLEEFSLYLFDKSELVKAYGHPDGAPSSAILSFKPQVEGIESVADPSTIHFKGYDREQVMVKVQIWGKKRGKVEPFDNFARTPRCDFEALDQAWVESQVDDFIKRVLAEF